MRPFVVFLEVLFLTVLLSMASETSAQGLFANTYGSTGYEYAYSIQQTADGGYIFAGPSDTSSAGLLDFWIVKLDPAGNVSWQKMYGGSSDDIPNCIRQTADGGYIVSGRTQSFGAGGFDAWVIRLDPSGNRIWQRTFGGTGSYDSAYSVVQNSEGGYYLAGWTDSYGAGSYDYWIIKIDSSGNSIWQRTMGGSSYDTPYASCLSVDDGLVVAGGGSVGAGGYDAWIVNLDSSGNVAWQKAFGGTADDLAFSIEKTSDGCYIVAGFTKSYGAGNEDFFVLKLDSAGNRIWQRTYGGSLLDWAFSVRESADGGYIVAGRTTSFGAGTDALILKLDSAGGIEWQRRYGSSGSEYAYCVIQAADGSYMIGGVTGSFGAGSYDAMLLKLEPSCMLGGSCSYLASTTVTVGSTPMTATTTMLSAGSSSCTVKTTAPTARTWTATKGVQCAYPVPPDEDPMRLTVTKSGATPVLSWLAPGGSCAITGYGVYRGTLPVHPYNHQSLECSVTDLSYIDTTSGSANYYLVVPHNAYLEGSYGTGTPGEIPQGSSPCKPKCLLPCL